PQLVAVVRLGDAHGADRLAAGGAEQGGAGVRRPGRRGEDRAQHQGTGRKMRMAYGLPLDCSGAWLRRAGSQSNETFISMNKAGSHPPAKGKGRQSAGLPRSRRAQRASSVLVELTQPRLPSSSSTSHIAPSFCPVGYSSMPGSRSRTALPVPLALASMRAARVTRRAWIGLAAEASSGRPPSWATRLV